MSVVIPGLCSVTLRQCSPREVVDVCVKAGLRAIEWGGDIHVPHGDAARAREVAGLCAEEGIAVLSYGSYFRMDSECSSPDFRAVLDTAVALGAKTIRVWGGSKGSDKMDGDYRARLVSECLRIAELAADAGCEIGVEYHRNTVTDSNEAAASFLAEAAHPAVRCYWQPREQCDPSGRLAGLKEILPFLCHLHVFQWVGDPVVREPLAAGEAEWSRYFQAALGSGNQRTGAFLEFVQDDQPANVLRDAKTLVRMIEALPEA